MGKIKWGRKASGDFPAGRMLASGLRHPGVMLPLLMIAAVSYWGTVKGWTVPILAGLVIATGLGLWRWRWPRPFTRQVSMRFRAWRRRWFRYAPMWWFWMGRLSLSVTDENTGWIIRPRILKVRSTECTDSLLIKLPTGMVPDQVAACTEQLRHAIGARRARTREDQAGRVWLDLDGKDPLLAPIPALPIPASFSIEDLDGLVIGYREDGQPWRLRVKGTHIFVVGVTEAGKSSVIWSVLRALAPFIRAGLVEVHCVDPKGGMEFHAGQELFTRFECDDNEAMVRLLEDDAAAVDERAKSLKGKARTFTPSRETPFVLVIVDELISLTTLMTGEDARRQMIRVETALGSLLSKGRAPGYAVLAAAQDASKDVNRWRSLFPTKIALRLDEAVQVDMVLGEGVRDRGGYADQIPESLPGVGFVKIDGRKEPVRVRAAYVSDTEIAAMARDYAAPGNKRLALVGADSTTDEDSLGGEAA